MTKTRVVLTDGDGDDHVVTVTGLARDEWAKVLDAHQPRPKSTDTAWNEATFPPALIARCTGLSVALVTSWWQETPPDASDVVFEACLRQSDTGNVEWAIRRLRSNPRILLEVRAATRAGLPRGEFLQWSGEDQDFLIAWTSIENDMCPGGCGVARADMQNPTAYTAVKSKCLWCQQLELTRESIPAEDRGHTHATLISKG